MMHPGGSIRDPLIGRVIAAFAVRGECEHADAVAERAAMVKAMGPIRLKYMGDDAPPETFRAVQRPVVAVDSAFDDEALRLKEK